MQQQMIGVYDAKTRLSQIIDDVVRTGRGCTITVHGKPTVDIVPAKAGHRMTRKEVLEHLMRHGGVGANVTREEIRSAIEEGRL